MRRYATDIIRRNGGVIGIGLGLALGSAAWAQGSTNQPPNVRAQQNPQSLVAVVGTAATLTVGASGTAPLAYQWRLEGSDLVGATNRILSFSKVAATNEGHYVAVVRNDFGAVTSVVARLTVIPPPAELQTRVLTNASPSLPYRLFVPTGLDSGQVYPLVMFLHGVGESGTDNLRQLSVHPQALAFVSYARQESHPTFFVAPQCPTSRFWSDAIMVPRLGDLLDALAAEHPVDTNRIYITGLSMGGYGCWYLLDRTPERFAAAIPICGGGVPAGAARFAQVPIWNLHAVDDGSVPIANSRNMIGALRAAGGHPVYTEYAGGGHGIWPQAYASPGLVEWTFAQTRGRPMVQGPSVDVENLTNLTSRTPAAGLLRLAGTARFGDEAITKVTWSNLLSRVRGTAMGSNAWTIPGLPLVSRSTNTLLVIASSASLAPSLGGTTTFSETIPLLTGLTLQLGMEPDLLGIRLSAPDTADPLVLQSCGELGAGIWEDAPFAPPVLLKLPTSDPARFFRLVQP